MNFRSSCLYHNSSPDSDAYLTALQATRFNTPYKGLVARHGPSCRLLFRVLKFRLPEWPRVSISHRRHHAALYSPLPPFHGPALGIGPGSGLQSALLSKPPLATRDVRQVPFRLCTVLGVPARRLRTQLLASGLKEANVAVFIAAHCVSRIFPGGRVFRRIIVSGFSFSGDLRLLRLTPGGS